MINQTFLLRFSFTILITFYFNILLILNQNLRFYLFMVYEIYHIFDLINSI